MDGREGGDRSGDDDDLDDDLDDDFDDDFDEPLDADLLRLLDGIEWESCEEIDPAAAALLHPSSLPPRLDHTTCRVPERLSPGRNKRVRRFGTTTDDGLATAVVPILFAVAGVLLVAAIVQLVPGEWPFWEGHESSTATLAAVNTTTTAPHPAVFGVQSGMESKSAVLTSPTGLLATISPTRPARSVTVTRQLWSDSARLIAWDEESGVAVYEISSSHPPPPIPDSTLDTSVDEGQRDEISVVCDEECPSTPGTPLQRDGALIGLVAIDETEQSARANSTDHTVNALSLERIQRIADELVKANHG